MTKCGITVDFTQQSQSQLVFVLHQALAHFCALLKSHQYLTVIRTDPASDKNLQTKFSNGNVTNEHYRKC